MALGELLPELGGLLLELLVAQLLNEGLELVDVRDALQVSLDFTGVRIA
jgi:hypothetical protein